MTKQEADAAISRSRDAGVVAHLNEFARTLAIAYRDMCGVAPDDLLVWDLVEVGKSVDPSTIGGTRRRGGLDFAEISQPWLRDTAMALGKELSTANDVRLMHKSCVIASRALAERHDQGSILAVLSDEDADRIYEAIRSVAKPQGGLYKPHSQRTFYRWFFDVIDFGLRNDLLPDLPTSFRRSKRHSIPSDPPLEADDIGKSIPVEIQRQLDAALPMIARRRYGSQTAAQRQMMFATIYTLLKDTGRRALEIASLKCGCVVHDPNGATLVYDNHKSGRLQRRLPITQSTAQTIDKWLEVRESLATIHEASQDYLFPGARPWQKHVRTHTVAEVFRLWVNEIEHLDDGARDQGGNGIPFDRSTITTRAFRHTYAQRHADNGTPVDVLQQLMDHRSAQTTGTYYVITADRKRKAIETIGKYSVDHTGRSRPVTQSTRYQMRSVAVPFGNCNRAQQRQSRRNRLPNPIPMLRMRLLPSGPLLHPYS
jgi:integrase